MMSVCSKHALFIISSIAMTRYEQHEALRLCTIDRLCSCLFNLHQHLLSTEVICIIEHFNMEVQLFKQLFQPVSIHVSTIPFFHSVCFEDVYDLNLKTKTHPL